MAKNEYIDGWFLNSDGVLFNKSKTELIRCPEGKADKSYIIPYGVISIEWYNKKYS